MKKLLKIITLVIVCSIGIISIKADNISYTYKKYRIQFYSLGQGTNAWTEWTDFGTSSTLSSGYGIQTTAVRLGNSTGFNAGNTYRIVIDLGISPSAEKQYVMYNSSSCYGTTSTSTWSNTQINDCEYIGMNDVNNSVHRKMIFDVTPTTNVQGIQINIGWSGTAEIGSVNVYNTTTITTGPDITGAIDDQTIVIQEEFEELTEIITQQNENLITAITENGKVCQEIGFKRDTSTLEEGQITSTGGIGNSSGLKHTDYIKIDTSSKTYNEGTWPNAQSSDYFCMYDENKTKTRCFTYATYYSNGKFIFDSFNENEKYIRLSIWTNAYNTGTLYVKSCQQQGQAIQDTLNEDHTYNNADITGDVDDLHNLQEDIKDNLNLDTTNKLTFWWNTTHLNWLWTKANYYLNDSYLNTIFTSFMALGIIKLILGR